MSSRKYFSYRITYEIAFLITYTPFYTLLPYFIPVVLFTVAVFIVLEATHVFGHMHINNLVLRLLILFSDEVCAYTARQAGMLQLNISDEISDLC